MSELAMSIVDGMAELVTKGEERIADLEAEVERLREWARIMGCGHPRGVLIETNRDGPENEDCDLVCGWCAEVARLRTENTRLRDTCRNVYTRVQRIQQQGRIAVPAALWILDRLHAALEPAP